MLFVYSTLLITACGALPQTERVGFYEAVLPMVERVQQARVPRHTMRVGWGALYHEAVASYREFYRTQYAGETAIQHALGNEAGIHERVQDLLLAAGLYQTDRTSGATIRWWPSRAVC